MGGFSGFGFTGLEFGIEACERTDSDMPTFVARWVFVAAESMMVVETIKWVHASTHFTPIHGVAAPNKQVATYGGAGIHH